MALEKRVNYLQIALNSTPKEAREIIQYVPQSERILIEAGTPLIKNYGIGVVSQIKDWYFEKFYPKYYQEKSKKSPLAKSPFFNIVDLILSETKKEILKSQTMKNLASSLLKEKSIQSESTEIKEPYIVADLKCADLAEREVFMAKNAGASSATCLGNASIATIDKFIDSCQEMGIDSMIDMMNAENPILVLKQLKKLPNVIILHRGVDETEKNKEKQIPYYQIKQIKGFSNKILVSVAGGDKMEEIRHAVFNDVDIVILWENFYHPSPEISNLANFFLNEIK